MSEPTKADIVERLLNDRPNEAMIREAVGEIRSLRSELERLNGIERAAIQGAMAAAEGKPLCSVADSGYRPRSGKGDAWERGWQYAVGTYDRDGLSEDTSKGCPELATANDQLKVAVEALEHYSILNGFGYLSGEVAKSALARIREMGGTT